MQSFVVHSLTEYQIEQLQMLFRNTTVSKVGIGKDGVLYVEYIEYGAIIRVLFSKKSKQLNQNKMSEHPTPELPFKLYKRKGLSEMRPYIKGEDLSKISVAQTDNPVEDMGMVARNPMNHEDQWYVAKKYFDDNLEPA